MSSASSGLLHSSTRKNSPSVILADKFQTLRYTLEDGLSVNTSVNGTLFGMEDQRHFGDASYKAFSSMPYSYPNIAKGSAGTETITIAVKRQTSSPSPLRGERAGVRGETIIRLGAPQPGANLPRLLPFNAAQANGKFFLDAYKKRAALTNESFYTWPLNVAVNLFDNDTWIENTRTPIDQARTVRAIAPRARQRVAVSLNAPYARTAPDPRGKNQFAAAWTVAVMANLCRAGVDEAMFDLDAPRPQVVLQRFEKLVGQQVLVSINSDSGARRAVESLALRDGTTPSASRAYTTSRIPGWRTGRSSVTRSSASISRSTPCNSWLAISAAQSCQLFSVALTHRRGGRAQRIPGRRSLRPSRL